ncbi:MAG: methionyl-tRNA formyltransferase [Anaerovoracaceae bacterium]|nr:methionyl-tRNA formyltransferase [Anaerovoracaceae bacterium]
MKAVFMGTPEFASVILKALCESDHEVELVVTQPDRARDRGKKIQITPVKETALSYGIPVIQPEKIKTDERAIEILEKTDPDIIVVAAYGQILPQRVLDIPRFGCVNVHASLLPELRGASPIQRAIAQGDKKSGVTIMKMAAGLDTGDIITQEETDISGLTGGQLHDILADMGAALLVKTLSLIEEGRAVYRPQDENKATYAGLISKKDGKIDFTRSPEEVERMIRAYDPWPGSFCFMGDETIKIWKAHVIDRPARRPSGEILAVSEKGIEISCGGKVLAADEIQAPGKKRLRADEYIRGRSVKPGDILR